MSPVRLYRGQDFILRAFRKDRKVYNYRIQKEAKTNLFLLQDRSEKFTNVPQLLQAYKEKPINPQLNVMLVAPLVQGTKRKQNSQAFLSNYNKTTQETAIEDIPGLHRFLPRSEVTITIESQKLTYQLYCSR